MCNGWVSHRSTNLRHFVVWGDILQYFMYFFCEMNNCMSSQQFITLAPWFEEYIWIFRMFWIILHWDIIYTRFKSYVTTIVCKFILLYSSCRVGKKYLDVKTTFIILDGHFKGELKLETTRHCLIRRSTFRDSFILFHHR